LKEDKMAMVYSKERAQELYESALQVSENRRLEIVQLKFEIERLRIALTIIKNQTFVDAEGPELRAQNEANHRRAFEALAKVGASH
jgi:hypothetical protein